MVLGGVKVVRREVKGAATIRQKGEKREDRHARKKDGMVEKKRRKKNIYKDGRVVEREREREREYKEER